MTREQFIAIQTALSYSETQMASALCLSTRMIGYIRAGEREVSERVAKRMVNALNDKIIELQRLRLFVV